MKDIKIVIGANFGDEGKGLMTDYFSQKENTIVVCSNGGAQRGHTVVTPTGIRHVFHHFGSGTFNDADTYLPSEYILNPMVFRQEMSKLESLGYKPKVYVSRECAITSPLDMMANQIIEEMRGNGKHGSCGLGIYETIRRYRTGLNSCTDADAIRKYYLNDFSKRGIEVNEEWRELFFNNTIYERFLNDLSFMFNNIEYANDDVLNHYNNIIFEAAQGLLLDQHNSEYYPHLTPSNTGLHNPMDIINRVKWNDDIGIEVCYVSRTYMTRHGAGKFPSECDKSQINPCMIDKTNVPNPHQDSLRYGMLDIRELCKRCTNDIGNYQVQKKSIAITHCNEFPIDFNKIKEEFYGWNVYLSDEEVRSSVSIA